MLILLPPSEAKAVGGRGRPLARRAKDTGPFAGPLADARAEVTAALAVLLRGEHGAAAAALLLPPAVAADALRDNARIATAPTTAALHRYTGVVYQGLAVTSLTAAEQRLAARCSLVFSGLFGVVRGDEPIPRYRVPASAVLPGLGVLRTWWRPRLTAVLGDILRRGPGGGSGRGLVVDLRSGDYRALWPPATDAGRVVTVRVLSPAPRGGHAVISHSSKLGKGRLAAALVRRVAAGDPVEHADDVAAAWATIGGAGHRPTTGGLDLYTG